MFILRIKNRGTIITRIDKELIELLINIGSTYPNLLRFNLKQTAPGIFYSNSFQIDVRINSHHEIEFPSTEILYNYRPMYGESNVKLWKAGLEESGCPARRGACGSDNGGNTGVHMRMCVYARRVSRSLLHLRRRFSRRRLCRNARTYNYALPLIKIHGGIMCLSVHARPSSFRLARTRSLARRWKGNKREGTERERGIKEREGERETRRRTKGEETTYEKKNKKERMEVGRGWRGTRYTHTQHNNIPAIIRWPHVCHCCATLSVMRVHRVHRRRINEKRECRGLIRGVESTFNAMEETPDDPCSPPHESEIQA